MIKIEKQYKIIFVVLIIYIFLSFFKCTYCAELIVEQSKQIGIDSYLDEMNSYVGDEYDIDLNNIFNNLVNTDIGSVKKNIFTKIISIFSNEFKNSLSLIGKVLIIVVISSILNSLSSSFSKSNVTSIGFFIAYISIIIIMMTSFNDILLIARDAIDNANSFMYSSIPIMLTLVISTGAFTTVNIFQPILYFLIQISNIFINNILLPLVLVFTVLNIVSNITEKDQLKKMAKFIKSSTIWALGLSLTILIGIMSLEGTLSSSIDGITSKTTKAAVTTFIPVVGKVLGDAVDTVMGCTVILKNSLGLIVVIVISVICLAPIIKIAILMGMYYFISAIIDPISDVRISKAMTNIADSLKLILVILISLSFMYIISITLLIKISNFSVTYR